MAPSVELYSPPQAQESTRIGNIVEQMIASDYIRETRPAVKAAFGLISTIGDFFDTGSLPK